MLFRDISNYCLEVKNRSTINYNIKLHNYGTKHYDTMTKRRQTWELPRKIVQLIKFVDILENYNVSWSTRLSIDGKILNISQPQEGKSLASPVCLLAAIVKPKNN